MSAAKAFYYCPSMISHRPRSQNISKEPNLTPDITPHPSQCLGKCIWRVCHVVKPEPARISCHSQAPRKAAKDRGEGGVIRGLI